MHPKYGKWTVVLLPWSKQKISSANRSHKSVAGSFSEALYGCFQVLSEPGEVRGVLWAFLPQWIGDFRIGLRSGLCKGSQALLACVTNYWKYILWKLKAGWIECTSLNKSSCGTNTARKEDKGITWRQFPGSVTGLFALMISSVGKKTIAWRFEGIHSDIYFQNR